MERKLKKIIKQKRKEARQLRKKFDQRLIQAAAFSVGGEFRSLEVSLSQEGAFPLLVEIRGHLFPEPIELEEVHPFRLVGELKALGLQAGVVVATDRDFLGGDPSWINQVKYHEELPVLQMDFLVDPVQAYESKAIGADAVLLRSDLLPEGDRLTMVQALLTMGLEVFIWAHRPEEISTLPLQEITGLVFDLPEISEEALHPWLEGLAKAGGEQKPLLLVRSFPQSQEELSLLDRLGISGLIIDHRMWMSSDFRRVFQQMVRWAHLARSR